MIRRPPRSTRVRSSAASDVYKRQLFLYGIVVGAIALFGLGLLLAGARRTSRRGSAARRGLKQSRRETAAVSQARDDLIDQRETARAYTASAPGGLAPERPSPPETADPPE